MLGDVAHGGLRGFTEGLQRITLQARGPRRICVEILQHTLWPLRDHIPFTQLLFDLGLVNSSFR
jgi:hypothetical protein